MSTQREQLRAEIDPKRRALAEAYHDVFAGPGGDLVLNDLMRAGGVLETSFVPGEPDSTSYNEGRRSMVLHVLDILRWSEGQIIALAEARTTETITEATQ